jgi:hypothetical protein
MSSVKIVTVEAILLPDLGEIPYKRSERDAVEHL